MIKWNNGRLLSQSLNYKKFLIRNLKKKGYKKYKGSETKWHKSNFYANRWSSLIEDLRILWKKHIQTKNSLKNRKKTWILLEIK